MAAVTIPRKMVNANDLIDAEDVAEIVGLSSAHNVTAYQSIYPEMPRPVVAIKRGRRSTRLWVRAQVVRWNNARRKR